MCLRMVTLGKTAAKDLGFGEFGVLYDARCALPNPTKPGGIFSKMGTLTTHVAEACIHRVVINERERESEKVTHDPASRQQTAFRDICNRAELRPRDDSIMHRLP